jgi:hypothetical protein
MSTLGHKLRKLPEMLHVAATPKISPSHVVTGDKSKTQGRKFLPWLHEKCHPSRGCGWEGARAGNVIFFHVTSQRANAGHFGPAQLLHAKNGSTSPASPRRGKGYGSRNWSTGPGPRSVCGGVPEDADLQFDRRFQSCRTRNRPRPRSFFHSSHSLATRLTDARFCKM